MLTDLLKKKAEDEAISWLARLRASDVTAEKLRDFSLWLNSSDVHKDAFDRMLSMWEILGSTSE